MVKKLFRKLKDSVLSLIVGAFLTFNVGCGLSRAYLEDRAKDAKDPISFKLKVNQRPFLGLTFKLTDLCWVGFGADSEVYELGLEKGDFVCGKVKNIKYSESIPGAQLCPLVRKIELSWFDERIRKLPKEDQYRFFEVGAYKKFPLRFVFSTHSENTCSYVLVPSEEKREKLIERLKEDEKNPHFYSLLVKHLDDEKEMKNWIRIDPKTAYAKALLTEEYFYLTRFLGERVDFETNLEGYIERGEILKYQISKKAHAEKKVSRIKPRNPLEWGDIDVSCSALWPGVKAGFSLGEFVDFLGGFVGYDLAGDDYKRN